MTMSRCNTALIGNAEGSVFAGLQQEILKGLLGDPSFQLESTRFVLVDSLRDFLGGPAFPPPTPAGATALLRCQANIQVQLRISEPVKQAVACHQGGFAPCFVSCQGVRCFMVHSHKEWRVCSAGHWEITHNNATITADSTGTAAAGSSPIAGSQLARDFLLNPDILPVEPPAGAPSPDMLSKVGVGSVNFPCLLGQAEVCTDATGRSGTWYAPCL